MFFYRIASFRKRKYCVQQQYTLKCDVTCPECVFLCPLFSSQASGQTLHSMVITGQTNTVAKIVIYRTTKEYRRNNKTDVLTFANICTQQELAKLLFSTSLQLIYQGYLPVVSRQRQGPDRQCQDQYQLRSQTQSRLRPKRLLRLMGFQHSNESQNQKVMLHLDQLVWFLKYP